MEVVLAYEEPKYMTPLRENLEALTIEEVARWEREGDVPEAFVEWIKQYDLLNLSFTAIRDQVMLANLMARTLPSLALQYAADIVTADLLGRIAGNHEWFIDLLSARLHGAPLFLIADITGEMPRLQRNGESLRLSGQVCRSLNVQGNSVMVLSALLADTNQIALIALTPDQAGVTNRPGDKLAGMRLVSWSDLSFDNVEIAHSQILMLSDQAEEMISSARNQFFILESAIAAGMIRGAVNQTAESIQNQDNLGNHQMAQSARDLLSGMSLGLTTVRALIQQGMNRKGEDDPICYCAGCKAIATELAVEVCRDAILAVPDQDELISQQNGYRLQDTLILASYPLPNHVIKRQISSSLLES